MFDNNNNKLNSNSSFSRRISLTQWGPTAINPEVIDLLSSSEDEDGGDKKPKAVDRSNRKSQQDAKVEAGLKSGNVWNGNDAPGVQRRRKLFDEMLRGKRSLPNSKKETESKNPTRCAIATDTTKQTLQQLNPSRQNKTRDNTSHLTKRGSQALRESAHPRLRTTTTLNSIPSLITHISHTTPATDNSKLYVGNAC